MTDEELKMSVALLISRRAEPLVLLKQISTLTAALLSEENLEAIGTEMMQERAAEMLAGICAVLEGLTAISTTLEALATMVNSTSPGASIAAAGQAYQADSPQMLEAPDVAM